jgi:demethylmenaquinone methyltransferase/2-methoxy-6-polyprenyl-1,4-benzoquinol methylase
MDAEASRGLFDRYAGDYDRVNTIISVGLDRRWRRWVARAAVAKRGARVLDAFAGTGLAGIEAARLGGKVTLADGSERMLAEARCNVEDEGVEMDTVLADLAVPELPFAPGSFDAVTLSFGIRYLDRPGDVLARLGRLLVPGGRLVVLEFVRPAPGPVSSLAALYFFRILPHVAGGLAHKRDLYDYLVDSTNAIGRAGDLAGLVTGAGYDVVERRTFGFGLVSGLVCLPSA